MLVFRQKDEWEAQGERAPHKHASKKAKTGSGGRLEATGQTTDNSIFGSGGSAFRVSLLASIARNFKQVGKTCLIPCLGWQADWSVIR